jgi:hypothetical protein
MTTAKLNLSTWSWNLLSTCQPVKIFFLGDLHLKKAAHHHLFLLLLLWWSSFVFFAFSFFSDLISLVLLLPLFQLHEHLLHILHHEGLADESVHPNTQTGLAILLQRVCCHRHNHGPVIHRYLTQNPPAGLKTWKP